MQRIILISVVVLAGLGVWLFTAVEPPNDEPGVEGSTQAGSQPGSDATAHAARSSQPGSAGGEALTGSHVSRSGSAGARPSVPAPGRDAATSRASLPPQDEGAAVTPGETESVATTGRVVDAGTTARVPDTDATGNGEPGAQDLGSPSLGSQTDDSSQSQSTNDDTGAPNLEGRGEPVTDEAVVDYLARRSLGENPTQEQLNERRGWAATLLSAEGNEVRDRIKARADEAAASK